MLNVVNGMCQLVSQLSAVKKNKQKTVLSYSIKSYNMHSTYFLLGEKVGKSLANI